MSKKVRIKPGRTQSMVGFAAEELYNAGMITETEYEEKRKEILKDL